MIAPSDGDKQNRKMLPKIVLMLVDEQTIKKNALDKHSQSIYKTERQRKVIYRRGVTEWEYHWQQLNIAEELLHSVEDAEIAEVTNENMKQDMPYENKTSRILIDLPKNYIQKRAAVF